MDIRNFGNTDIRTSAVVFGGGFVGGILIDADDETRRDAIRLAIDGGINWIDTAPMYGQGKSEEAIGWLLKEINEDPIISTKVNLDTTRLDDVAGQVEESLTTSLRLLDRDAVDVVHLHNCITPATEGRNLGLERVIGSGGALEALEAVRDQGLTRYIGITALGDTECCAKVIHTGRIHSAQVYYNMINPSAARGVGHGFPGQNFAGLLETCRAHGVGTMGIRVLAAGILATDVRHGREIIITDDTDVFSEEIRTRTAFTKLGLRANGHTPYGSRAETALRYVLAEPMIDCAIVGLAELDHLSQVLNAAVLGPLPSDAVAVLG
mgnify:CR=1 FL=1